MPDDDLARLEADLGIVSELTNPLVRKAVEVGARNIKNEWRGRLSGARYLPGASRSISYDVDGSGTEVNAEIGPELGGQGSLVGGVEVGTLNGVSPRLYGLNALVNEQADFQRGLERAVDTALREAGL